MLLCLVLLSLFSLLASCDIFMRDDCWCRNATHLGWQRHYQLNSVSIEGGPQIIDEWCFQETHDGRGECLDQHTKQYEICASHQAAHNVSRRNDFCYHNHGNERGYVTHWSKGDDLIRWNRHKRNIPFKGPPLPMSTEDTIKYCEPICRDYRNWNLPVMDPWSPSQHGVVESRHQIFTDVADFPFEDGAGGEWPIKAPEPKFPGGISTTGGGTIDFWETDMDNVHKVRKRDWEASFVSAQETALARNVSVSEHKNA